MGRSHRHGKGVKPAHASDSAGRFWERLPPRFRLTPPVAGNYGLRERGIAAPFRTWYPCGYSGL